MKNKILITEEKFTSLFCKSEIINNNIIKYTDKLLPDMYDHNYFDVQNNINDNDLKLMLDDKKKNNNNFIKIFSRVKQDNILKGFDFNTLLTLIKDDLFITRDNNQISFVSFKENLKYYSQIINIEKRYYGKNYSYDFCTRKMKRYLDVASNKNNNFDYILALDNNKVVGYCYVYNNNNNNLVLCDSLLVIKSYRNKYIASNLLKYISNKYKCPLFLHADELDTPKLLYFKLGFKIADIEYEYFKDLNPKI